MKKSKKAKARKNNQGRTPKPKKQRGTQATSKAEANGKTAKSASPTLPSDVTPSPAPHTQEHKAPESKKPRSTPVDKQAAQPTPVSPVKLMPNASTPDHQSAPPDSSEPRLQYYRDVSINELSEYARSVKLDPKMDKQRPHWLQKTMDNVIYYMAVPDKKTLREKIWHHRLRTPILYALTGITIALLANLYDVRRIYRMQGDWATPPAAPVRPPLTPEEQGDTLNSLLERHNQEAYRIENKRNMLEQEWPDAYIAELERMQNDLRDKGDFMAWMDVKRERERFENQQAILDRHVVKNPEALRSLQLAYHNITARYQADMDNALRRLNRDTLDKLETLRATKTTQAAPEGILQAITAAIEAKRSDLTQSPAPPAKPAVPETPTEEAVPPESTDATPRPVEAEPPTKQEAI